MAPTRSEKHTARLAAAPVSASLSMTGRREQHSLRDLVSAGSARKGEMDAVSVPVMDAFVTTPYQPPSPHHSLSHSEDGADDEETLEHRVVRLERENRVLMDMLMRKPPAAGSFEPTEVAPKKQNIGKAPEELDDPVTTRVAHEMTWLINQQILTKRQEVHRLDVEMAKARASLEQLRRCYQNPYPGHSVRAERAVRGVPEPLESTDGSFRLRTAIESRHGAYLDHFRRWLIPEESSVPIATVPSRSDCAPRTARPVRTHKGAPISNVGTVQGHPLVLQNSQGVWVKLTCPCASKGHQIRNIQGFINHCRILHSKATDDSRWTFKNHKEAADFCGDPEAVDEGDVPFAMAKRAPTATASPTIPSPKALGINHLARRIDNAAIDLEALAIECKQTEAQHGVGSSKSRGETPNEDTMNCVETRHNTDPANTLVRSGKGKQPSRGLRPHANVTPDAPDRTDDSAWLGSSNEKVVVSDAMAEGETAHSEPPTLIDDCGTVDEEGGISEEDVYNRQPNVESWLGDVGQTDAKDSSSKVHPAKRRKRNHRK